jgi:uncharacterized protein YjbI with pentapeptide repeats
MTWFARLPAIAPLLLCASLGACGNRDSEPQHSALGQSTQALTASQQRILGFEELPLWSLGQGQKSLSVLRTEGAHAFSLNVANYTELESVALGALGTVPDTLYLDVSLPSNQVNPWWFGAIQMYATVPSANLFNEFFAQNELTGKPVGSFFTLAFKLNDRVKQALASNPSDLRLKISINVPAGNGAYLLDALRFQPKIGDPGDPGAPTECHPYIRVGVNGDVRYQLTAPAGATAVNFYVAKNRVRYLEQALPAPKAVLPNGNAEYAFIDAASNYAPGDELSARFSYQVRDASGAWVLVWKPGPGAQDLSAPVAYSAYRDCIVVSDADLDGEPDTSDQCPNDPTRTRIGIAGCGTSKHDTDGDKVPDVVDECDNDPTHIVAGTCGCKTRPAPAGVPCNDGAAVGAFKCDGAGTCGALDDARPPWVTGPIVQTGWGDSIILVVPQDPVSCDQARAQAPAGYELVRVDDAREQELLRAVLESAGVTQPVLTDGRVIGRGLIAHVTRAGTASPFWDELSLPKNVDALFTNWANGQPSPDVTSGCVTLDPRTGEWKVSSAGQLDIAVFERTKRVLSVDERGEPIRARDFPGLKAEPNAAPGSEPCTDDTSADTACDSCLREQGATGDVIPPVCQNACACLICMQGNEADPAACAAQCPNVACELCRAEHANNPSQCDAACAGSPGARSCGIDYGASCTVTPADPPEPCVADASCDGKPDPCTPVYACSPGKVCGIVVTPACDACRDRCSGCAADSLCPACPEGLAGCAELCRSTLLCGTPLKGCGQDIDKEPGDVCSEVLSCADPRAEGHPDPDGTGLAPLATPIAVQPAAMLSPAPAPVAGKYEDEVEPDPADVIPGDPQHPWCHYQAPNPLAKQSVENAPKGRAGRGKVLEFDIDPNLALNYELDPLPQGQFNFDLRAQASLGARVRFDVAGIRQSFPVLDAVLSAKAQRCGFTTLDSKFELFGLDFFVPPRKASLPKAVQDLLVDKTIPNCAEALDAFQEVADRARKAMRDAQELLTQYHDALKTGACFNGFELCDSLVKRAPAGFPKLTCTSDIAVEDVINSFIYYYHAHLAAPRSKPSWPSTNMPKFEGDWPRLPDPRLPNLGLLDGTALGGANFGDLPAVGKLPNLQQAVSSLSKFSLPRPEAATGDMDPNWIDEFGCGSGAKTERQTLIQQPFALGPIPMLLEVESVLKYGIDGQLDFDFKPDELAALALGSKSDQATIASVTANARPCVSAGLGLFVGAGFKTFGFRATAGVEGVVNLGTLSVPAQATASIKVSAQNENVSLEPQLEDIRGRLPGPVRELSDKLKGFWDGAPLPIQQRRFKVDLGYTYGLKLKANEILAGHLRASLQIKFAFWRKRWSKYLVNFGSGIDLGTRTLLAGENDVALVGGIPWGTIQAPSPFIGFRYLERLPAGLIGSSPSEIAAKLPGYELPIPKLASLGWDTSRISGITISAGDLSEIGKRLGYRDLLEELQATGIDIANLKLADLTALGYDLSALRGAPLTLSDLQVLNLSLDDLAVLGINLPGLALDRIDLSRVSVAHLERLALSTERLARLEIEGADLPELAKLLGRLDLETELATAGVNLNVLALPDLQRAGIALTELRGMPLTMAHVDALALSPAELRRIGAGLSGIALDMDDPDVLFQSGLDLSGISLADLARIGKTLSDLTAISLDPSRLLDISSALGIPDIRSALRGVDVDPSNATVADLGKIGIELADLGDIGIDLASLKLSAQDLIEAGLGRELSGLTGFSGTCTKASLSTGRVGDFFYDHQCTCQPAFDYSKKYDQGEQDCSNSSDCCDGLTCAPSTVSGGRPVCRDCGPDGSGCKTTQVTVEKDIDDSCACVNTQKTDCDASCKLASGAKTTAVFDMYTDMTLDIGHTFPAPVLTYRVFLDRSGDENGTVDDSGYVHKPSATNFFDALPISSGYVCGASQIGTLLAPMDITSMVELMPGNELRFRLRAHDECGTALGWSNIKVRYVATLAN